MAAESPAPAASSFGCCGDDVDLDDAPRAPLGEVCRCHVTVKDLRYAMDATPLLFGVDAFTAQSVGLPLDPPADETLADAICCDPVYTSYPEPKGLYAEPSVRLFKRIDSTGETTFYDSVSIRRS